MRDSIEISLQNVLALLPQIITAIVILVIFFFIGKSVSKAIDKVILGKRVKAIKQTRLAKRIARWGFNLMGFVIALNILGLTQVATSFLAAGGVLAVILGFAFREIGENLLAGFFLSFSRSFDVGDLIESNGIRGVVKRIEVRDVHIRTAEGCDIYIPSAIIFKNPLHNFTRDGLRRSDFTIGIDYGDDLEGALKVLNDAVKSHNDILKDPPPTILISEFSDNSVVLKILYWVNIFESKTGFGIIKSQIMSLCHTALAEHNFTFSSNVTTAIDMLPVQVKLDSST